MAEPVTPRRARNFNDLSGRRFGRLIAIEPVNIGRKTLKWRCRCDCGGSALVAGPKLRSGNTRSCRCLQAESLRKPRTHGLARKRKLPPEYKSWSKIKSRCYNPRDDAYKLYGARGIAMCERWRNSFVDFLLDLGSRPGPGYTVERLNNERDYEPGNCCWATKKTQANNRRSNLRIAWHDREMTLAQWAAELGIRAGTLNARIRSGWPLDRAFTEPVNVTKHHKSGLSRM